MNRYVSFVVVLTLSVLCFVCGAANTARETLPGALAEIDAAAYPSLQAAFEAVSESGGLVQLPVAA